MKHRNTNYGMSWLSEKKHKRIRTAEVNTEQINQLSRQTKEMKNGMNGNCI